MELTKPEKLILSMLCDIYRKLDIKDGIDAEFVSWALHSGETWALEWAYPGIFDAKEPSGEVISETVDILAMWDQLEGSYKRLSDPDRARVASEAEPFGNPVQFSGFDGNHEPYHLGVASTLVDKLDRFSTLGKGRDLNSHAPLLEAYQRMLAVFDPINRGRMYGQLTADEIIAVLKELTHPSHRR